MNLQQLSLSDTTSDLLNSLNYQIHSYVKDQHGKYLDCNDYQARNLGFTKVTDLIGLSDFDFQYLSINETNTIRDNDMQVMKQPQSRVFIEPVALPIKRDVIAISNKMPLYSHKGKIIGVTGISMIIDKNQYDSSVLPISRKNIDVSSSLIMPGLFNITPREVDCLYHLVKGKTARKIGAILSISHRTAEQYLLNCKRKLKCNNRQELIEKALQLTIIKERL